MSKGFKKICGYIILVVIGFLGYTLFRKIKAVVELSKTLPQYLKNILGEKPKFDFNMNLHRIIMTFHLSPDVLKKNPDLKETILDYINDFYPVLSSKRIEIELVEKDVEQQKEQTSEEKKEEKSEEN